MIVHQHGCGEGSCKSGLTGAFDLHWQALAKKHDCALLSPSYEQPDQADCQMWCDPRNGWSERLRSVSSILVRSRVIRNWRTVPWALWGHSGGGHWAGGMALLHPRSCCRCVAPLGCSAFEAEPGTNLDQSPHGSDAALNVPIMCNPGTKEGVTDQRTVDSPACGQRTKRSLARFVARGGLIGVAVDPLTSHECGNQRYLPSLGSMRA